MKKVICLDDGKEFFFVAKNGYEAISKMLYTLNLSHEDKKAKIELYNNRVWSFVHNGKIYGSFV